MVEIAGSGIATRGLQQVDESTEKIIFEIFPEHVFLLSLVSAAYFRTITNA
jgi:hypothetical protein